MRLNPQIVNSMLEEYDWSPFELNFGYDAYWYEYISSDQQAAYRNYLSRVEPFTNLRVNKEPYSMVMSNIN